MTGAFLALLPVFLVILAGYGLRRGRLLDDAVWPALDQLCYYVLFPAIMFKEIAGADFTGIPVWSMAFAMMLAICIMSAVLWAARALLREVMRVDGPQFSSFFQGATRWHTFIALAIIPIYFGPKALALGGLSAAAMTPLLAVINIAVISYSAEGHAPAPATLVRSMLRNPFIVATLVGVAWQILGLPAPALGLQVLDIIGRGALGLALLAVGAGLRVEEALAARFPVLAATVLKLLAMPLLMLLCLKAFAVSGPAFGVALLCGAVPTGSGAYVLARQMGGDAPLVANILTLQVICAAVTIPLILGWFA